MNLSSNLDMLKIDWIKTNVTGNYFKLILIFKQ